MKKKFLRVMTSVLSLLLTASTVAPIGAAEATAELVDGVSTVFVSSFGRMSYGGKVYTAFKSFDEGLAALPDGGKLIFNGMSTYSADKIGGGRSMAFCGFGQKTTASVLAFEIETVTAQSDLHFSNLSFEFAEDAKLIMNGHDFTADADTDVYYTIPDYKTGERSYKPYVNLYSGNAAQESYRFDIAGGHYGVIAASSDKVQADAEILLSDTVIDTLYLGSFGGTMDGDVTAIIEDCTIGTLYIGAVDGNMNGTIHVTLSGGSVDTVCVGAYGKNASFDGTARIDAYRTEIASIGKGGDGKSTAGVTYFLSDVPDVAVDEKADYDQILRLNGGTAEAVYEDGKLVGVICHDSFGCLAKSLTLADGSVLTPDENGVFALENGKYEATIASALAIELCEDASFVAGYADGTFRPDGKMTRAEVITLLTRVICDEDLIKNGKFESTFTDLSSDAWYYNYIAFFEKCGFLHKVAEEGGDARPNDPITRGEFVQLIYNIDSYIDADPTYADFAKLCQNVSANIANAENYNEFSDVNYNNPHDGAIYFALANGYVAGYADGSFRPDNTITRAEVVTVINRFLGRNPTGAGESTFSDISDTWAKDRILAAVGEKNVAWTASGETTTVPSGETLDAYVKVLMDDSSSTLTETMANHVYKTATACLVAPDITAEQKATLSATLESIKEEARFIRNPRVYSGDADNLDDYVYGKVGGLYIRETVIEGRNPDADPVEIVQISDTHFNYINEYDLAEANPSIMSTKEYRTWLAGGSSQPNAVRAMEYARYSDQTVITGDILDYLSYGCKELTVKNLFRKDTDLLACLGGHDTTRVMQGKVSDPTSFESRMDILREFWPNDTRYASKVVKNKAMCVVLDNANGGYWEEQIDKLAADIQKAREENLVILIFEHEPICTHNPDDHEIHPLLSFAADGTTQSFDDSCYGKDGTAGATLEVYNLIRNNADVIRGVFCGHYHGDYHTAIKGSYTDENGNVVEQDIPQYILTANAYGTGHVMKITVK